MSRFYRPPARHEVLFRSRLYAAAALGWAFASARLIRAEGAAASRVSLPPLNRDGPSLLARAKTDSIDALGIARFAAQKRPAMTPPRDEAMDELRELVRFHDRLAQDAGDRVRQLHRLVALCFPEFTRHVRTLDSQRAILILREHRTAEAFDDGCLRALAQLRYGEYHKVGEALAHKLVSAAKISVARHHSPAYRNAVRFICADLDAGLARKHPGTSRSARSGPGRAEARGAGRSPRPEPAFRAGGALRGPGSTARGRACFPAGHGPVP